MTAFETGFRKSPDAHGTPSPESRSDGRSRLGFGLGSHAMGRCRAINLLFATVNKIDFLIKINLLECRRKGGIWLGECARTIENISRIRMDAARASGTDLASSLRQNTFLIEKIDL